MGSTGSPLNLEDYLRPQDDEDSLTFGERIGGARPSYPAIPKAAGALSENTPAPQGPIQLDPSKMPDIMAGTRTTPPPGPAPVGDKNPTLVDLLKQRAAVGTAIDPRIPGTSQTQPKYRMGLGQRILGGIADFGEGFSGRAPSVYIGPGATNRQFSMDEAARQSKVANIDTQIKGQESLDTENIKRETEMRKAMYDAMMGNAKLTTAGAAETKANAYSDVVAPSIATKNVAQAGQATSKANQTDVTRPRQQMGDRMMEKQDDGTWKDIGPAPKKQFAPKSAGKGNTAAFDKIERDKQMQLQKAELNARKEMSKIDPTDIEGRKAVQDQLELDKQQAQADYEARIQEKGGSVTSAGERGIQTPPQNKNLPAKNAAPAKPDNQPAKVATPQHIAAYAQAKGITEAQAKKEFQASGYTVK